MFCVKIERHVLRFILIVASLNIAEVINGFGATWPSPMNPKLLDIDKTPLSNVITLTEASWVASCAYLGVFGAYVAGYTANIIGRRPCLIIGGIMKILAHALLAAAKNISMVYAGRVLVGFSMSALSLTSIVYIGEIAPKHVRGVIFTITSVFHALGVLLVYSVGPYLSYIGVGYVAIGLTAVYIVTSFYLPESPVYHVIKDNEEAAKAALIYLGRNDEVDTELKIMIENAKRDKATKHVWRELFTVRSNLKSLLVTVPLFFFQESCGIITITLYSTTIFKDAGSSVQPDIATIIVGATLFFGTIFSPMFIEKYGRKILLIVSISGCGILMAVLGVYFYLKNINHQSIESLGWLPLASLVLALLSYSIGFTIIPNTLTGELFEANVRGLGSSISYSTGWLSGWLSATVFGYIVVYLGIHFTFWIFAIINLMALIFVIILVPETKGKSLTEINVMMAI